ncbi:hypothetical protein [Novosphingobium sp. AP12]|uniref:hypothetical protein n=1 Tax=Novosphingobium sp. AP12 TaxID=1144305 RepID=UPI0002721495|nr:hypothetical protein [Novosphingobium sp. AP12]EJL32428.1 hypothetical protein PMI02_01483 [Novosphingobium sp. AP12]
MIDQAAPPASPERVETALREQLVRGDAVAGTAVPILRHLIAAGDVSLFNEEIVTRLRAMLADIARQLLDALMGRQGRTHSAGEVEVVGHALLDNPALVSHLHALALEWQLTERLYAALGLDPVASPLLQELIASPDEVTRNKARAFLAAQARWCQAQRRMSLPLTELPADLLNVALYTLRTLAGIEPALAERATVVEGDIRRSYDEQATRLGRAAHLVAYLVQDRPPTLWVAQAGVPLFLTAIAIGSGQGRDAAALSMHRTQTARLGLTLRAAGLGAGAVAEQCLLLHPEIPPPHDLSRLSCEEAGAMLSSARPVRDHTL